MERGLVADGIGVDGEESPKTCRRDHQASAKAEGWDLAPAHGVVRRRSPDAEELARLLDGQHGPLARIGDHTDAPSLRSASAQARARSGERGKWTPFSQWHKSEASTPSVRASARSETPASSR